MLGYQPAAVEGRSILEITPKKWVDITVGARTQIVAEGRPLRYEKEYIAKDGRRVPVDLVADLLRDESGEIIGLFSFITDLSERKATEQALRDSEGRFRLLFDEAPFGYHEIDTQGIITAVNRTESELLGYVGTELLGQHVSVLVDPEDQQALTAEVEAKLAGKLPLVPFERRYRRQDGKSLTLAVQERLRVDDQRRVLGLRSTLQDITESKQMEAALRESNRRAQALFNGISDAIFVHDCDGRLLEANPAATRLLGYSREELLTMTTAEIDAEGFGRGFQQRLKTQLSTGHLNCEGRHRAKNGRIIPVEIQTTAIKLGDQTAVMALIRDITERRALEETRRQFAESQARHAEVLAETNRRLRESEARYRELTEATLDAVLVADEAGLITLFNPSAEALFDYGSEEVIGSPLSKILIVTDGFEPIPSPSESSSASCTPSSKLIGRTVEMIGLRKNGEQFPLELSLNVVDHDSRRQFIGSIRDLTERQRMRDILIQTEKLASIGLLSAGVAHEINNPLAYVANNLAVLQRDIQGIMRLIEQYESTESDLQTVDAASMVEIAALKVELDWDYVRNNVRRLIDRTRDGVQRVASIVQNLRGMARTDPLQKERVPIVELISSALEMAQSQIKKARIEIEVDTSDDLREVPCVASQVGQVLLNLIINATQAIQKVGRDEGGCIAIRVRDEGDDQVIEVADDGCGIPVDHLPKLFDPFFTTKPVGEGTGLGLAISHSIVTAHGGSLEVQSNPNLGTTFRIRLPVTGVST